MTDVETQAVPEATATSAPEADEGLFTEPQEPQEPVQLTFADLAAVVQLVDAVSARGAFQGPELSQVGILRDRFEAFVKQAQKQQEEAEAAAEA